MITALFHRRARCRIVLPEVKQPIWPIAKRLAIIVLALGLSFATGCASSGRVNYDDPQHKQLQSEAMARWSNCLDTYLDQHFAESGNAKAAIETSLELCQGHRFDVLATYPRKLEKPLDKKLTQQAYTNGMHKFAETSNQTIKQKYTR